MTEFGKNLFSRAMPDAACRGLAIADALEQESINRLMSWSDCLAYAKGQTIFQRGDPVDGLYVLSEGQVHLVLSHVGRQEKILRLVKPGEIFGDVALFMDSPRVLSAIAAFPSVVRFISGEEVFRTIQEDKQVARSFLALLSRQIHRLVTDMEFMGVGSGMVRLAQFLLNEAQSQKLIFQGCMSGMVMPAAKRDIASLLNLSKEHFSRMLADLVSRGLITMSGRYVGIPDEVRLRCWISAQTVSGSLSM